MRHPLWVLLPVTALVSLGIAVPQRLVAQHASVAQIAVSDALVRSTTAFLQQESAQRFRAANIPFSTPLVVPYRDSIDTPCGRLKSWNAYSCRLNRTIYYDREFVALMMAAAATKGSGTGATAVEFTISHEWGHELQYLLGLNYSGTGRSEPDADCIAGSMMARSRGNAALTRSDAAEIEFTGTFLADEPLATGEWGRFIEQQNARNSRNGFSNSIGNHGNPRERLGAFKRGFGSDMLTCFADIPSAAGARPITIPPSGAH